MPTVVSKGRGKGVQGVLKTRKYNLLSHEYKFMTEHACHWGFSTGGKVIIGKLCDGPPPLFNVFVGDFWISTDKEGNPLYTAYRGFKQGSLVVDWISPPADCWKGSDWDIVDLDDGEPGELIPLPGSPTQPDPDPTPTPRSPSISMSSPSKRSSSTDTDGSSARRPRITALRDR